MIKLTRIDDRLVHGQVAFTWTPALGIDYLVVANDRVAGDEFLKMTLNLAKPAGVKLLLKTVTDAITFLNDPRSTPLKILVLVDSVRDAYALTEGTPEIRSVNFGGLRAKAGSRPVSKAISLTDDDLTYIRLLLKKTIELEARQVPTDKKTAMEDLI